MGACFATLTDTFTEYPRYKTYAYDNMKQSIPFAKGHAMKYAVIAPSMMYLLYPLNGSIEGYPKEKFVEDLVNEVSGFGDSAQCYC